MNMNVSWDSVKLSDPVLRAVKRLGFNTMTPIQSACIPLMINRKDVCGEAVTGSGKTLAFLIPILEILQRREDRLKKQEVGALIISPTRELATQIYEVLLEFLKELPQFSHLLVIGGNNPLEDIHRFQKQGANIVVATPGRLEDLYNRKTDLFSLSAATKTLEVLILDEADRLLEMGFETSINFILSQLPKLRRTGLFSATQTKQVESLMRAGLRNPVSVNVKEEGVTADIKTPSLLHNYYYLCQNYRKLAALLGFLQQHITNKDKVIIFALTCAIVEYFGPFLQEKLKSLSILTLHGKMKKKRHKIFEKFRMQDSGVLLCTDVMARGIDIPAVDWVIQLDPPSSAPAFVHRCGRTARAGREGRSLLLLYENELPYVNFIQINQKVKLRKLGKVRKIKLDLTDIEALRRRQLKDRAFIDQASRAFVSFIQAYAKHECSLLLRVKDLNLGLLATCFGLLELPKMPELRNVQVTDFTPQNIDLKTIPYKNKEREASRLKKLEVYNETGQWPGRPMKRKKTEAWSEQKDKKRKKQGNREKRKAKKMKKIKFSEEELHELSKDAALVKKEKKKKISKNRFTSEFCPEIDAGD